MKKSMYMIVWFLPLLGSDSGENNKTPLKPWLADNFSLPVDFNQMESTYYSLHSIDNSSRLLKYIKLSFSSFNTHKEELYWDRWAIEVLHLTKEYSKKFNLASYEYDIADLFRENPNIQPKQIYDLLAEREIVHIERIKELKNMPLNSWK